MIGIHPAQATNSRKLNMRRITDQQDTKRKLLMGSQDCITLQKDFRASDSQKYITFTFVRNPYTRLLLPFRFLKNGGIGKSEWQK